MMIPYDVTARLRVDPSRLTEMRIAIRKIRDRREEEQRMAQLPSPAMMALAQVAANQLQEWLPGYPILIAGDGPARVSFLDREEGRSIAHVAFVNQVFEVEFDDGCTKRYKVSVTVRDLDDGG